MELTAIDEYYSRKIREHGASPAGADWNGEASQRTRFEQLEKLIGGEASFSVNDLGCGYGALLDYFRQQGRAPDYLGIDLSAAMIAQASARHKTGERCRFITGDKADRKADYTLASGIFNVRLEAPDEAWKAHMLETLDAMRETSARGFAFNGLTSYSDASHMKNYLYYADPCEWFDRCKKRYSKNVALLHDYGLYEFTLIVRLQS